MTNNLGRDQVWTPEIWGEIDKAVQAEVGRIRVAQKVFPSPPMPNALSVPADLFDPATMTIAEGQTKPFIEISVEFALTSSQIENESMLRTARTLARLAAKIVALAEDLLLFQGARAPLPDGVQVINRESAGGGLLGVATANTPIMVPPLATEGVEAFGEATFRAVTQGIAGLIKEAQPEPHALFLETIPYADTYAPLPTTLVTTADRLIPLLKGGFHGTGTLPANTGLLVSLAGEPTTLYVAQDAITAYTQEDRGGNYRFRVFERVQFVARDPRAFIELEFRGSSQATHPVSDR